MSETNLIKLKNSCIMNVPLYNYEKSFTFIINGQEFKTSRIVADLLSPTLSKIHMNDPTINIFTINTQHTGDFSRILDLATFNSKQISQDDLPFFIEIFEILGSDSIEFQLHKHDIEITVDNVVELLNEHERYRQIYSDQITKEISFISSHISEFIGNEREEKISEISLETLYEIFNNDQLQVDTEDQLLKLINRLNSKDDKYSILYETVLYENVSKESIIEFLSIYDNNTMTNKMWYRLSARLAQELKKTTEECEPKKRYKNSIKNKFTKIDYANDELKGIISYMKEKYGEDLSEKGEMKLSSGLNYSGSVSNLIKYDSSHINDFFRNSQGYLSIKESDGWIEFDFVKHKVNLSSYTIRTSSSGPNFAYHAKSWRIVGSNDRNKWELIDRQVNNSSLNDKYRQHRFLCEQNQKFYQYIRYIQDDSWISNRSYCIWLTCFEFFGSISKQTD